MTTTEIGGVRIEKYGNRAWSVYEDGRLLCVTMYKKGALAVAARIASMVPIASAGITPSFRDITNRIDLAMDRAA